MIFTGSTVKVIDEISYIEVCRVCSRNTGRKAAGLMDSHTPWDR